MTEPTIFRHLQGIRNVASAPLPASDIDDIRGVSMQLVDVEMYTILMETSMDATLKYLPSSLHPSIPAVMAITMYNSTQSPIGPFSAAVIGLGCRSGIKPRMLSLAAFANTSDACELFGRKLGYPVREAELFLAGRADSVRGEIRIDGSSVLDIVTVNPIDIVGAGGFLKVWGPLNSIRTTSGPVLLQSDMSYEFKRLQRGQPRVDCYNETVLGTMEIRPTWPIMGALSKVDIGFQPTRYLLDVEKPAGAGGVTNLSKLAVSDR